MSSQSGVASEKVTEEQVRRCFDRTIELLGLPVADVAFCPHPAFPAGCFCRKPMPGLGIRLARKGDSVVGMSVVQPDSDLLVLSETGYGKRVALTEFRSMHRGSQGVRLMSLEGRKTGDVAAVQQVTDEDEELLLISAHGQVIRTETNTINRYSSSARGVIVMRLAEGDRVEFEVTKGPKGLQAANVRKA